MNQTFINWELLIVDDGSSEEESKNLTELVIQLKDPRIQVLIQNKNLGGGAARSGEGGVDEAAAQAAGWDTWLRGGGQGRGGGGCG